MARYKCGRRYLYASLEGDHLCLNAHQLSATHFLLRNFDLEWLSEMKNPPFISGADTSPLSICQWHADRAIIAANRELGIYYWPFLSLALSTIASLIL